MADYDDLRAQYGDLPDREKLAFLRAELHRILGRARGWSALIDHFVEQRGVPQMPDDFPVWTRQVVEGLMEADILLGALTDPVHRVTAREQVEQRQHEQRAWFWREAQACFPELAPYASLDMALRGTATHLRLPLWSDLDDDPMIFWDAGGLVEYRSRNDGPRARCSIQRAQRGTDFIGYGVTLMHLVDQRNMTWEEHSGITQSLEEVTTVLSSWLGEQWSIEQIGEIYPWMRHDQGNRRDGSE